MFYHAFKNTLKTLLRQKALVFWGLIFPIALAVFFKLSLQSIESNQIFEQLPVAINENLMEDEFFSSFINELENEVFMSTVTTESKGRELLEDAKVVAYIHQEDQIVMTQSGVKESIVESVMNSYLNNKATIIRVLSEDPTANIAQLLNFNDYFIDESNPNMSFINTYFYTLIGMQAMYGYMWGLSVVYQYEANLSTTAKRNTIAPISKWTSLIASLLVAWLIHVVIMSIAILFIRFGLNINLGDRVTAILGLVGLGALTGVSFGMLLGVSNKQSMELKIGIGISVSMAFSFLAGMMVAEVKILVQRTLPFLNMLNPVALITDGMYAIYYYPTLERYWQNMLNLGVITIVFMALSLLMMRGKQYDSL